jgi:hypothetical protein
MPCKTIDTPGGGTAIVCSRGRRNPQCSQPGCRNAGTQLCDFKTTLGDSTCDKPWCKLHAKHVGGRDLDYCPEHASA